MVRIGLVAVVAVLIAAPTVAADSAFVYGTIVDLNQTDTAIDIPGLEALKFNTISCWATLAHDDWSLWLPRLDSIGISVWGTNGLTPLLPEEEQGHILSSLHKRSHRRCLYSVWQAEDTTAIGNPVVHQLTHRTGNRTTDGWEVLRGRDEPGNVQSGPGVWIGGGRPNQRLQNYVEYALRLTDTSGLRPETPVCRLYGTYRKGGCQFVSNPIYDTVLHTSDFAQPGTWHRFLMRYQLAADAADLPSGCDPAAKAAAIVDFKIDWFGLGGLEIDWVRGMDTAGWELVLGPEELRRGPIKAQAAYFKDSPVAAWFGDESGWHTPYKIFAYFFADSLIQSASEGRARLVTDMHIGDVNPVSSWDYFMYASLRNGDRLFNPWISVFWERNSWSHNLDSIQTRCYDVITGAVQRHLKPWLDTVPDARWIPDVQCFSSDPRPDADPSPTANDVVCLTFLYLTHGAKGVLYHRYDGGRWSSGVSSWGLVYSYDGARRRSVRYYAIRDRVTPLIVDLGWGDTLMTLRSTGAGSADTVRHISGSIARRVRSHMRPMYLEAGFFVHQNEPADYVMLVNRRTTDTVPQSVSLELNRSNLQNPGARHYRITDMRTYESSVLPASRLVIDNIEIGPGDPAFLKIEAVDD